jgi:uncharacterized protein YndB with AHSA1/START domain
MTPDGGPLVVERRIQASPETVFGFFADPRRWLQWQGLEAELDPRPGGVFRMNVRGDGWAVGRFLQVDPPRRIVFTWGWEIERSPLPPGSSVVEVELIPQDDGTWSALPTGTSPPARSPPTRPAGRTTWTGWPSAPVAVTPAQTPSGSALEPTPTPGARHGCRLRASAVEGSAGQPLDAGSGGGVQADALLRTTSDTASASGATMSAA